MIAKERKQPQLQLHRLHQDNWSIAESRTIGYLGSAEFQGDLGKSNDGKAEITMHLQLMPGLFPHDVGKPVFVVFLIHEHRHDDQCSHQKKQPGRKGYDQHCH